MGIVLKTPQSAIEKMVEEKAKLIKRDIFEALSMVGEECIIAMRNLGNYDDQTGNLRSSTGFMIVQDGKVMTQGGFEQVKDGDEGVKTGKKAVAEVAKQFPEHSVLIVVAGMKYGVYVERRGYDVITSGKLRAKEEAPRLLKEMGLIL